MSDKEPAPTVDPQDYNRVVDAAELVDVKLVKSSFDLQPAFFAASDEVAFRYGCDLERSTYDQESNFLVGEIAVEAGCKLGRRWVLKVRSTYVVAFSVAGKPPVEAAKTYLERVGRFTAYPYFRAHFAALCSAAGAEVPPLPVLKGNLPRRIFERVTPKTVVGAGAE